MVVAVHTHPFMDINENVGFFFTYIFPRIGVPFFFAIIGYFYIGALLAGKNIFLSYGKRILIIYFIWTVVYFLTDILQIILKNEFSAERLIQLIKQYLTGFFISGSYYHFWFFPALFFALFVTTIAFKLKIEKITAYFSIALYIIGCLGCSYYAIGNNIPVISNLINFTYFNLIRRVILMGLPFFMMGYFLHYIKLTKIKNLFLIFVAVTAFLIEIFIVIKLDWQRNIMITLFLFPLLALIIIFLLNNPLPGLEKLSAKTRNTANFIYYSHPLFIIFLIEADRLFKLNTMFETYLFLFTVILASVGSLFISLINNKWLNKLMQ